MLDNLTHRYSLWVTLDAKFIDINRNKHLTLTPMFMIARWLTGLEITLLNHGDRQPDWKVWK
jgi:hypothetical protein